MHKGYKDKALFIYLFISLSCFGANVTKKNLETGSLWRQHTTSPHYLAIVSLITLSAFM